MTFEPDPYAKEHKLVIAHRCKPKINNVEVLTFEEEFQHYLSICAENKKMRKWASKEGFLLEWDLTWKEMQSAYWVYPPNKEIEEEIRKKFKIIDTSLM